MSEFLTLNKYLSVFIMCFKRSYAQKPLSQPDLFQNDSAH